MRLNHFAIAILLVLILVAQSSAADTTAPVDLRQLKRDINVFSGVLDTTMRESVTEPFGLLEATKGAYLPGFGLVFNLELNLVQLRQRTLFDVRPLTKQELDQAFKQKKERIAHLEESLPRVLADYGSNIELPPSDRLAVVVYLFKYPEEDPEAFPSRLVAQASRQDLLDFKSGKLAYSDFAKRVEIVKF